ncbi:MAG: helix-turn-helix domain-containing protein [Candidatus Diapherotrites archaeon]
MPEVNKPILKQMGLTENEIEVYLTLLRVGSSSVSSIAEHSRLYRPYVYDTLKKLQEKGLISSVGKEGKKFFRAAKPQKLMDFLKDKEAALESIMPSLESLMKAPKEDTIVELYKGKGVVKTVQRDVLNTLNESGGESLVIGVDEQRFMDADPIAMGQFFNEMKRNKIEEKVLVREGDNYLPAHKETTKYRFISKEFFSPMSTFIYGNKVAIILFGEPLHGLIIKSELLSESYRKQFHLLWKTAKTEK